MKKLTCILLVMLMCCAMFTACNQAGVSPTETTEEVPTMDPNRPLSDGKTLKVLAVGNSFSDNTTDYLYDIAKAEGMTDIAIGRLYISGCTLATHLQNAQLNLTAYEYGKNTDGYWNMTQSVSMRQALQDEDWDIITVQQGSGTSGVASSYGDAAALVEYINANKKNPNARLVWHMTWAYQQGSTNKAFPNYGSDQMTMYTAICDAVKEAILPMKEFHSVIPTGTAIQNARTSSMGDNLTRDTYHLNDLGKVIGSYTWYAAFTEKPLEKISVDAVGKELVLTETDKAIIIESVNNALQTPFAVTESVNK